MTSQSSKKDYKSMYERISQEYKDFKKKSVIAFAKLKVEANESDQKIRELEAKLAKYEQAEAAYKLKRTNPPEYEPLVPRKQVKCKQVKCNQPPLNCKPEIMTKYLSEVDDDERLAMAMKCLSVLR